MGVIRLPREKKRRIPISFRRLFNFMVVGGIGFIVNLAIYYPLTHIMQATTFAGQEFYLPALLVCYPTTISLNYYLNRRFTFRSAPQQSVGYLRYLTMGLATVILDVFILFILVQFGHLFYLLAFIIATCVMFLSRYAIATNWIWNVR